MVTDTNSRNELRPINGVGLLLGVVGIAVILYGALHATFPWNIACYILGVLLFFIGASLLGIGKE